jgi:nitrogen fixation protein FixH
VSGARERTITGRHVLIAVLVFFGLVIAANGAFVFLALDTFTGVSTEDAYRRGLAYNETLREAADQRALGWRAAVEGTVVDEGRARIAVTMSDRAGRPLEHLAVTGMLRRPTQDGFDRALELARVGPGRYAAEVDLPLAGQWDLELEAVSREGKRFRIEERLWLK